SRNTRHSRHPGAAFRKPDSWRHDGLLLAWFVVTTALRHNGGRHAIGVPSQEHWDDRRRVTRETGGAGATVIAAPARRATPAPRVPTRGFTCVTATVAR